MKNYFEYGVIIPFDKVILIRGITNKDFIVEVTQINNYQSEIQPFYSFPIEQFAEYKQWLEMKQKDLENKVNKPIMQMNKEMQTYKQSDGAEIPETKWLIDCWGFAYGRKFDSLVIDEIEDFLHDCLGILDYAGALNNKNRGNILIGETQTEKQDWKPSIEQVEMILKAFGYTCGNCIYINKLPDEEPCQDCQDKRFKLKSEKYAELISKLDGK